MCSMYRCTHLTRTSIFSKRPSSSTFDPSRTNMTRTSRMCKSMRLKTWSVQNWCSIQFNERVGRTQVSPQDKCCEVKNIISVRSEYLWRATAIFRLIKAEAEELKIDFRALRQPVTLDTPLPSAEAPLSSPLIPSHLVSL